MKEKTFTILKKYHKQIIFSLILFIILLLLIIIFLLLRGKCTCNHQMSEDSQITDIKGYAQKISSGVGAWVGQTDL